jgi:hypothetical protein
MSQRHKQIRRKKPVQKLRTPNIRSRNKIQIKRERRTANYGGLTMIKNAPRQTRVIRYLCNADTSVTFDNLLTAISFATGTTTAYSIIGAMKIQQIRVTALPDALLSSSSLTFAWECSNSPEDSYTFPVIIGEAFSHSFYPPSQSIAGWWFSEGSADQTLFSINVTTNQFVYVDIHFEYVLEFSEVARSAQTVSGAVANTVLYPIVGTAGGLTPVDLPSG